MKQKRGNFIYFMIEREYMKNFKPFLVKYCILKVNKTHYKVLIFCLLTPTPPRLLPLISLCSSAKAPSEQISIQKKIMG
jgi:hypothetical protein